MTPPRTSAENAERARRTGAEAEEESAEETWDETGREAGKE